jgi:hypothetical protein
MINEQKKIMMQYFEHIPQPSLEKKATGFKVNVAEPLWEQIGIPSQHPIFSEGTPSQYGSVAILTYRQKSSKSLPPHSTVKPYNPAAALHITITQLPSNVNDDSSPRGLQFNPKDWAESTCSILIVEQKARTIDLDLLRALCSSTTAQVSFFDTNVSPPSGKEAA